MNYLIKQASILGGEPADVLIADGKIAQLGTIADAGCRGDQGEQCEDQGDGAGGRVNPLEG